MKMRNHDFVERIIRFKYCSTSKDAQRLASLILKHHLVDDPIIVYNLMMP